MHLAVRRERQAEGPPARLLDDWAGYVVAVFLGADGDLGEVVIEFASGGAAEQQEHAGPVGFDGAVVVSAADVGAHAEGRTVPLLPAAELRQVDADHHAGRPARWNR